MFVGRSGAEENAPAYSSFYFLFFLEAFLDGFNEFSDIAIRSVKLLEYRQLFHFCPWKLATMEILA
eukprot:6554209-Ditylum_brightwellii.AAC.1